MKNKILKGMVIFASVSMLISGCGKNASDEDIKQIIMDDIENSNSEEKYSAVYNNYSDFVKYGDKVYFKASDGESKDRIALMGKFREDDEDSTALYEYDMINKMTDSLCKTTGYGKLAISSGYIYFEDTVIENNTENKYINVMNLSNYSIDNIKDQLLLGADKSGSYACTLMSNGSDKSVQIYHGKQLICKKIIPNYLDYIGIDDKAVYVRTQNLETEEVYLTQVNIITGEILNIGKLPIDPDKEIKTTPRVDQFVTDDKKVYLAYGFYDSDDKYIKGYHVIGEIGKENSVQPSILKKKDDMKKTPSFYVKKGKMKKADGEPFSVDVDIEGNIGYYNASGQFVAVASGYNSMESYSSENIVETPEYVDGMLFFVKESRVHISDADERGKEAYKRKYQSIAMIGADKIEWDIHNIDFN